MIAGLLQLKPVAEQRREVIDVFNEYVNDEGRVIHATATAYDAIYKAQGFRKYVPAEDVFLSSLGGSSALGSAPNDNGFAVGIATKTKRAKPAKS